ncbi:MAG: hypothetical protein M3Y40_01815 [Chloroflexota bacterium]|nr:hypothetical protein [Chloroflexota bacterium]
MLIPNHPDDERLSALAAREDDALADATLTSHVSTCTRCTDLVTELGWLRASLAELPDLVPHRPLRLLPPVADAPGAAGGGLADWVRRLFAPALTAGAAIAMVGLVGTAGAPLANEIFANVGSNLQGAGAGDANEPFSEELQSDAAEYNAGGEGAVPAAAASDDADTDGEQRNNEAAESPRAFQVQQGRDLPAERSIWPMVLFTGIALMVGAALLRWILVPRAG